jgi:hypothetical protein
VLELARQLVAQLLVVLLAAELLELVLGLQVWLYYLFYLLTRYPLQHLFPCLT